VLSRLDTLVDRRTAARWTEPQEPGRALIGRSGTPLLNGRGTAWEPNLRYLDRRWWSEAVPLLEICPPVATACSIQTDLVASANVSVGGRDPDPAAAEWMRRAWSVEGRPLREYQVRLQTGEIVTAVSDPWEVLLRRITHRAVHHGCYLGEWTAWVDPRDGLIYPTRLHDRDLRSVWAWVEDEAERLCGVLQWQRQLTPGTNAEPYVHIPISQLLHIPWDPRSSTDYDGNGLLRAVADEAFDHSEVGNELRIGARMWAIGELDIIVDTAAAIADGVVQGDPETWEREQYARMEQWARQRYTTEGAALVRNKYVTIGRIGGGQGYNPYELVRQRVANAEYVHQRMNTEFVLVGGTQAGGSYSAAEVKIDRASSAAQNILDILLGHIDRTINWPLLRANFPDLPSERFPRLEASGLRAKAYLDKLAVFAQLIQLGAIKTTAEDERQIRRDTEFRERLPGEVVQSVTPGGPLDTSAADAANTGKRGPAQ